MRKIGLQEANGRPRVLVDVGHVSGITPFIPCYKIAFINIYSSWYFGIRDKLRLDIRS